MLKNTARLVILVIVTALASQCTNADVSSTPPVVMHSPFTGTWISEDSDNKTAFKLNIVQHEDSIIGNYCLVRQAGQNCDCFSPSANLPFAFTHPVNTSTSIETWLVPYNTNHGPTGRLHLSLNGGKLFWQIAGLSPGNDFHIKQTTFYRDSTFH